MPCYCDIPDDSNQEEIEKRAKTRMYFDAQAVLIPEQIEECKKRKLKMFPMDVNTQLCQLCKVLTIEQMQSVRAYYFQIKWPHKTLYDWHIQHCVDDLKEKE